MQGIVMGAAQMLTQGFNNCTNLQDRNIAPAKRHGLPNRLQTSSYGARKVLSTISNRKVGSAQKLCNLVSEPLSQNSDNNPAPELLVARSDKTCLL